MKTCPQCGAPLVRVPNSTWMSGDQWDAVKAGDWYCGTCPPLAGRSARFQTNSLSSSRRRWPESGRASKTEQMPLFSSERLSVTQQTIDFDAPHLSGSTYEPEHDGERLAGQMARVFHLMADGSWRTLAEIKQAVGGSEAGISARLRDFRKNGFGAHTVDRRRRKNLASGFWEYRLQVNGGTEA